VKRFNSKEQAAILKAAYALPVERRSMVLQLVATLTDDADPEDRTDEALAIMHYYTITPRALRRDWQQYTNGNIDELDEPELDKKPK
jgi:hypothetical protein